MMKSLRKIREYFPLGAMIMVVFTLLTVIFQIIIVNSVGFANFFNYYISAPVRAVFAWISGWLPLSFAEIFIITSPIWLAVFIFLGVKSIKKGKKSACRYLSGIFCIILFIANSFVWTFGSGFHTTGIDEQLGLKREKVAANELYDTALWLTEKINYYSEQITYDENGSSKLTYNYRELSHKLCDSYKTIIEKYDNLKLNSFKSRVKPIMLSEPFTYTHISGVYTFMTGEANINTNYPDFIVTSSVAHELAHQRGIAREDEANFIAFLVCINTDDPYVQYSGYLDVYQSVMKNLRSADKDLYKDALKRLGKGATDDLVNYSEKFDKYRKSKAAEISNNINDSYLEANGQKEGTRAYDMVTDLVVAYYKSIR